MLNGIVFVMNDFVIRLNEGRLPKVFWETAELFRGDTDDSGMSEIIQCTVECSIRV